MAMRRYSVGDRVRLQHDATDIIKAHPDQALLTYEVVRLLPEEWDGKAQYQIKSDAEPYMRLVAEDRLAPL